MKYNLGKFIKTFWVSLMIAPLPATKLNEVIECFGAPGIKDLNPFGPIGKRKTELKKSMMALISNDPVEAHTGLGIIYVYDNQYELAHKEFKTAYVKSKYGFYETIHLANFLFIFGHYEEAINLYLSIENYTNELAFLDIANRFISYCFKDELNTLFKKSIFSKKISDDVLKKISEMEQVISFLNKYDIPIGFYRDVTSVHNRVFYRYYSLPTETGITVYHDWDFQTLSYSIDLDLESIGGNYDFIANMNDELQDLLIDVYEKHTIAIGSDKDRITVYFKITDEVKV